jgi:hypothetical protein
MKWSTPSPELRARELLNLVRLAMRCAELADADDAARRAWHAEAGRAWARLRPLLPSVRALGPSAGDVLAVAEQLSAAMPAPARAPTTTHRPRAQAARAAPGPGSPESRLPGHGPEKVLAPRAKGVR